MVHIDSLCQLAMLAGAFINKEWVFGDFESVIKQLSTLLITMCMSNFFVGGFDVLFLRSLMDLSYELCVMCIALGWILAFPAERGEQGNLYISSFCIFTLLC